MLRELSAEYDVIAVASPDDDLDYVGRTEGIPTIGVRMKRHISPFNDLRALWQLYRMMRRERPWMVHSMTPKAGLLCMMAAWMARVPVRIHTFTGLVFPTATGLTQKILITTDRILCRCATHIIPEGEGVKRDLQKFRITRKPLKVLAYGNIRGIDLKHYDRTPQVMQQADKIRNEALTTFIFIGRIVRDKGINELIEAFSRLNSERPNTRLLLVGRYEPELDPIHPSTRQAIDSNQAIEAVGSQSDVRPWLAASDVLILPSYREGFPNAVIEAGAMGLPSIVTDINGANEIIIHDRNGVIIPPRDSDAIYKAMLDLTDNPDKRTRLASEARQLVASRYDCHIVRNALYDFYHSLQ